MAIKFGVRAKVNELRGEYVYLEERIAIGVKAKITSTTTPVATFAELYDRMIGALNYLNSVPRNVAIRDAFAEEFEVAPASVVPLFDDIIAKVTAIRDWVIANQQNAKETYTLDGTNMSSRTDYTVAEMSGLTPLLDDLLTALAPVTEP